MRKFLLRLLGAGEPSKPSLLRQLYALVDRLEALEGRVEKHRAEFKELRGFAYALKRGRKAEPDLPGDTQEPDLPEVHSRMAPRPVVPTAGLARRFRVGG